MCLDDSITDGESKTGSCFAGFCREERIKDFPPDFFRNSVTMILDRESDPICKLGVGACRDTDLFIGRPVRVAFIQGISGIDDKVEDNLGDLFSPAVYVWEGFVNPDAKLNLAFFKNFIAEKADAGDDLGAAVQAGRCVLLPREGEQITDDAGDAFAFGDNLVGVIAEFRIS